MSVLCGFCLEPIPPSGKSGRPAKYCSPDHRAKASRAKKPVTAKNAPTNEAAKSTKPQAAVPADADKELATQCETLVDDTQLLTHRIIGLADDLTGQQRRAVALDLKAAFNAVVPEAAKPRAPKRNRAHVEPNWKAVKK